jgi:hypothetical protein
LAAAFLASRYSHGNGSAGALRIGPAGEQRLQRGGRPLESHEVIVELIGATTTHTGLRVRAELDRGRYPLGVKVCDKQLAAVPLVRHEFHGEWNYTLRPAAASMPARRHSATGFAGEPQPSAWP